MIAKLKAQCPKCSSEIYIESGDKPIKTELGSNKTEVFIYECPVCKRDVRVVCQQ